METEVVEIYTNRIKEADDPRTLGKYQVYRAIYVNGKEIGWGYEAPWEEIREAIGKTLEKL